MRLAVGPQRDEGDWTSLSFARTRQDLSDLATARSQRRRPLPRLYGPTLTALTYGELLHLAEQLLQRGQSVKIDGDGSDQSSADEAHRLANRAWSEWVPVSGARPGSTSGRAIRVRSGSQ